MDYLQLVGFDALSIQLVVRERKGQARPFSCHVKHIDKTK